MASQSSHHSLHPQSSHFRSLINKEGRVNVHSRRSLQNPFADLYHYFFSLSWSKFFIHIAAIYFLINLFFGGLYFIFGVDALTETHTNGWERFRHCVFLSIESMSAVDYSRMGSAGLGPYILMTIQAFLGL